MKLICKLIGHKMHQYLQVTDTPTPEIDNNSEWVYEGMPISKKIYTYFLCQKCFHRHKQTESFCTELLK